VNEFPRESLLKLFSYAVAALSNFSGIEVLTERNFECRSAQKHAQLGGTRARLL